MRSLRRWWCRTFRTRVEPATVNRNAGKVVNVDRNVNWQDAFDFVEGWKVSRPDWWGWGSRSGVSAVTVEEARARLDDWQDDMARRA